MARFHPRQVANNRGAPFVPAADAANVTWKDRILHFTWPWFSCTMSTGAIAVLLSNQPFTFNGLRTIGKIFYILDLVLFVLFFLTISARFIIKPAAFLRSLRHPKESFFFGAFQVSAILIINNMQQYGVQSTGTWLTITIRVLFWIQGGLALIVAIFEYYTIFNHRKLPVSEAIPGWILPAYPFLVLGPLAAAICTTQAEEDAQSGLNIWVAGVIFQGLGWTLAFLIYTMYFTRLVSGELPPPSQRPGMYVGVGPAAYTAQALVQLGVNAPNVIPVNFLGVSDLPVGDVFKCIGVIVGMFLFAVAFWFFAVATVSILASIRDLQFTLNAWAFIFPNAGLALAIIAIGNALDSDGIRGVGSGVTILLVAVWLVVAVFCIKAVLCGTVMWPGKDEGGGIEEDDGDKEDDEKTV